MGANGRSRWISDFKLAPLPLFASPYTGGGSGVRRRRYQPSTGRDKTGVVRAWSKWAPAAKASQSGQIAHSMNLIGFVAFTTESVVNR